MKRWIQIVGVMLATLAYPAHSAGNGRRVVVAVPPKIVPTINLGTNVYVIEMDGNIRMCPEETGVQPWVYVERLVNGKTMPLGLNYIQPNTLLRSSQDFHYTLSCLKFQ